MLENSDITFTASVLEQKSVGVLNMRLERSEPLSTNGSIDHSMIATEGGRENNALLVDFIAIRVVVRNNSVLQSPNS